MRVSSHTHLLIEQCRQRKLKGSAIFDGHGRWGGESRRARRRGRSSSGIRRTLSGALICVDLHVRTQVLGTRHVLGIIGAEAADFWPLLGQRAQRIHLGGYRGEVRREPRSSAGPRQMVLFSLPFFFFSLPLSLSFQ